MRSYENQAYALLRMVAGFLFLWHGMSKLFGIPTPPPPGAPPFVIYVGGGIELVAGALVMLGFFTHAAAFIASGQMAATADPESGRARRDLLLRVPLHRGARRRHLERGRDARRRDLTSPDEARSGGPIGGEPQADVVRGPASVGAAERGTERFPDRIEERAPVPRRR